MQIVRTDLRRRAFLIVLALIALFGSTTTALADKGLKGPAAAASNDPRARAAALKAEGDALMDSYQYAEALEKYAAAFELSHDPALLYNQGRALELMGRYPEALKMLRDFDAQATPELHARVPNLAKLIEAIEGKTCEVEVRVTTGGEPLEGATINLGKEVLGTSPLTTVRVNSREMAHFEIVLEGYDTFAQDVALPSRGMVVIDAVLVPKDKRATLRVDSPVKGASVLVDDNPIGQVPTETKVSPGPHKVRLTAEGYEDNEVEVDLKVAEQRLLMIEPGSRPVYKQWWFWTITGGVVVAGGASVLAWAFLTEGEPDQGTIPPCTVPVWTNTQAAGDCPGSTAGAASYGTRGADPSAYGGGRAGRASQSALRISDGRAGFQIGPIPVIRVQF